MKITDDVELDQAIEHLDKILDSVQQNEIDQTSEVDLKPSCKELEELSDAIEEYESGTDVLNRNYKILPAKDKKGFLLCGLDGKFLFRIYEEDKSKFKDYKLSFADMQIEIKDGFVKLYESKDGNNKLDYSPQVLGLKWKKS